MLLDDVNYLLKILSVIIPGFLFIKFYDRVIQRSSTKDSFEFIILSSFIFIVLYNLSSSISEYLSNSFGFDHLLLIFFVLFFFLLVFCLLFEKYNVFGIFRKCLFSTLNYESTTVWDAVIPGYCDYVIVYTSDGLKYCGQILLFTCTSDTNSHQIKEIFLHNPVILNEENKVEECEVNLEGVLLLNEDIKRIEFLDKIKHQKTI
ncbi:hypothetical protein FXW07_09085 [Methanosarcina sp. DH1]|uniref:DUF6338 family protein n=1 Tax=Methanosarcina sp. DH1 TaxID=2605695 RepID=UPI001E39EDF2|nr:DUF6338 family protein [Methanosarcina sp. DH1]MCC4766761.1 hypothetical protein [Methanosarcina sp. DH1]